LRAFIEALPQQIEAAYSPPSMRFGDRNLRPARRNWSVFLADPTSRGNPLAPAWISFGGIVGLIRHGA